ncbi:MAG: sulfatase-like hydrolase/transferase [Acidobacteriota bacterium]|nr:MAG: sulfatase-like hydrolase/transferase [Acidobacteriota bacterium]
MRHWKGWLCTAAALLGIACSTEGPKLRNAVLVTASGVRADHLNCYGYTLAETPSLNELAERGALFQNCLTPVPSTLPSAATILTGTYPPKHGILAPGLFTLSAGARTLASLFKEHGYETAAFVSTEELQSRFGLARGFDLYDEPFTREPRGLLPPYAQRIGAETLDSVEDWLWERRGRAPFFMWVHLADATLPYAPPPPFDETYSFNLYDGEVAYVDSQVGRLVQALRSLNFLSNTVLVFTSEHGEGLLDHYEEGHGLFVYQNTLQVPLIVSSPEYPEKGKIFAQVQTLNVAASMLELAGVPSGPKEDATAYASLFHGTSFVPKLREPEKAAQGDAALIQNFVPAFRFGWRPMHGLVSADRRWKYMASPREALYKLERSEDKEHNVLYEQKAITESMRSIWRRLDASYGLMASPPLLPPEVQEALRRFGDGELARKSEEGILRRTPSDPTTALEEIKELQHMLARRHPEATVRALDSLEKNPYNPEILRSAAELHLRRGAYADAEALYVRLVSLVPQHADGWAQLGNIFFLLERLDDALVCLEAARRLDPRNPVFAYNAGNVHLEAGRVEEGAALFEESLALGGERSHYYYNLAAAYERLGRSEEALALYRKALARWSGGVQFRNFIAATIRRLSSP